MMPRSPPSNIRMSSAEYIALHMQVYTITKEKRDQLLLETAISKMTGWGILVYLKLTVKTYFYEP